MEEYTADIEKTIAFTNDVEDGDIKEKRRAVLQVSYNSGAVSYTLDAPQIVIGRSKEADLPINDHYLSGKHARILVVHNFYYIEDLGSLNGTKVNGETVSFLRLAHKDEIRVGQTTLRFIQLDDIDENYITKLNLQTIQSLALAVEAKDPYTKGHSERVAKISEQLATTMGLRRAECERLRIAGILHDIGKIGVPESLLLKNTKLDDREYEMVKQHPVDGLNILKPLNFLNDILPAIYHHHERFDGTGYPDGLSGEKIPLWARVIQVADTYDAMTTNRPYRAAFSKEQAISEISRCAGSQLDPHITRTLLGIL